MAENTLKPAIYNQLVQEIELESFRLIDSEYFLRPQFLLYIENYEYREVLNYSIQVGVGRSFIDIESARHAFVCRFDFSGRKGRRKLIKIRADYIIIYKLESNFEEEYLKEFAKNNARVLTYPYFRVFMSNIAGEAGLELPTLPLTKLSPDR